MKFYLNFLKQINIYLLSPTFIQKVNITIYMLTRLIKQYQNFLYILMLFDLSIEKGDEKYDIKIQPTILISNNLLIKIM